MTWYVEGAGVALAGVIANDVGRAKDGSGLAGLGTIDEVQVACAVVSCGSARVGDAQSTYYQVMFESPDHILFEVVYIGPL